VPKGIRGPFVIKIPIVDDHCDESLGDGIRARVLIANGEKIMKYHFKIHKEDDGFWADCLEIPGCVTQGDSREELFVNMQDAINTYLEEPKGSFYLAPLPDNAGSPSRSVVEVAVDPAIALGFIATRASLQCDVRNGWKITEIVSSTSAQSNIWVGLFVIAADWLSWYTLTVR
jgi:predicted RNase H-like HicB family nuclease